MKKWKLIIAVALIFILGAMAGVLGTGLYIKNNHPLFQHNWTERKALVLNRLTRELALNDTQIQQVSVIVDRIVIRASEQFQQQHRKMENLIEGGNEEIKKVLNPDQLEAFEKYIQMTEQRRQRMLRHFVSETKADKQENQ